MKRNYAWSILEPMLHTSTDQALLHSDGKLQLK